MPGGWKVIESGTNRKPKWRKEQQRIEQDDHFDDEGIPVPPVPGSRLVSDNSGYKQPSYQSQYQHHPSSGGGGGDEGFVSRLDDFLSSDSNGVNTGRLMTSEEWSATGNNNNSSKKGAGGGSGNLFKQLEQQKANQKKSAATRADNAQRQKDDRKAKQEAAERERVRREEAKEQARLKNTPSEWPVLHEALDADAAKIKAAITASIDSDVILSNGGVGAFIVYAPSIVERHTSRTQVPDGVLTGERLLLEAVVEEGAAKGAQEVVRYLAEDVLGQYPSMVLGTSDHNAEGEAAIISGVVGLLSNVYGAKGSKIVLAYESLAGPAHPASGTGAELALQLIVSRVAPVILENLDSFLPTFFGSPASGQVGAFHTPASFINFINFIRCALVNAKTASTAAERTSRSYFTSEERRLAVTARATASLLISGVLGDLVKAGKGLAVEEVFQALEEGVKFVSGALRGNVSTSEVVKASARGAYNKLPWKNLAGDGDVTSANIKKSLASLFASFSAENKGMNIDSTRFYLVSELVCRQHAGVAKIALQPLLEEVDTAVLAQGSKFKASTSPQASLLFSCCAAFPAVCVPAWRTIAVGGKTDNKKASSSARCRFPHASLLLRKFLSQASVLNKDQQATLLPAEFLERLDTVAAELGSTAGSVDVTALTKQISATPILAPVVAKTNATVKASSSSSKKGSSTKAGEVAAQAVDSEDGGFPWLMLSLGVGSAAISAWLYYNAQLNANKQK